MAGNCSSCGRSAEHIAVVVGCDGTHHMGQDKRQHKKEAAYRLREISSLLVSQNHDKACDHGDGGDCDEKHCTVYGIGRGIAQLLTNVRQQEHDCQQEDHADGACETKRDTGLAVSCLFLLAAERLVGVLGHGGLPHQFVLCDTIKRSKSCQFLIIRHGGAALPIGNSPGGNTYLLRDLLLRKTLFFSLPVDPLSEHISVLRVVKIIARGQGRDSVWMIKQILLHE